MRKLIAGIAPRAPLLIYVTGAIFFSAGTALVFVPAGVIAVGVLLLALVVVDVGGKS